MSNNGTAQNTGAAAHENPLRAISVNKFTSRQDDSIQTFRCVYCGRIQFDVPNRESCIACHRTTPKHLSPQTKAPENRVAGNVTRRACAKMKALRLAKGITQTMLAESVGCPRSTISKYENGYCNPTLQHFVRFCQALGVDMADLFNNDLSAEYLAITTAGAGLACVDAFMAEMVSHVHRLSPGGRQLILKAAKDLAN